MDHQEKKKVDSRQTNVDNEETTNLQEEENNMTEENETSDNVSDELTSLQKKYEELNDTHLRLRAEFDNYRKRTMREKADLIKSGGENALKNLLPIIDDFERALQNVQTAEDIEALKEGINLIHGKFINYHQLPLPTRRQANRGHRQAFQYGGVRGHRDNTRAGSDDERKDIRLRTDRLYAVRQSVTSRESRSRRIIRVSANLNNDEDG